MPENDAVKARDAQNGSDSARRVDVVKADQRDHPEPAQAGQQVARGSRSAGVRGWFSARENQLVLLLALVALVLHLCVVPYGTMPIFDEYHYVPEALSIIHDGQVTHPEHPPLAKLFIALGITVFGDNPWGWRIPSVVFGVASVVIFYFICRRLAGRLAALLATALLVFETLTFVFSGLAMLDVFSLTFMLLSFLLYLRGRCVFSGVSLALSALCKMTGLFGGLVILIHWALTKRRVPSRSMGVLLASAVVAFLALMPLLDFAAAREWLNPFARVWDMLFRHQELTWAELPPEFRSFVSYPWEWILSPSAGYYFGEFPDYRAIISPTVWILIMPSVAYMLYEAVKSRSELSVFALAWFAGTYLPWVLLAAAGRVTYLFYFYPTVGAICLPIGLTASRLWRSPLRRRSAHYGWLISACVVGYFLLHLVFFLSFIPLLPALASYLAASGG
jgi:predicted membrane-bound dolichyl-phosphate-mannose-protein mannosyltransferase